MNAARPSTTSSKAAVLAIILVSYTMILIGIGQGFTLSPLTVSGIAGVAAEDAGAASGLVNVAHQLGGSLGLGVLVVVFALIVQSSGASGNRRKLKAPRGVASTTSNQDERVVLKK